MSLIERGLSANPNMKLNPDPDRVKTILKAIEHKEGYCPCVVEKTNDTRCPCKKMREQNKCCCKLYVEV